MSGLDLRHRETMLEGGGKGPALVPGKAEESLLFLAASHGGELKMPPGKPPLPSQDLDALRDWIDGGAPWDSTAAAGGSAEPAWWSLRRPRRTPVPTVSNQGRVRNPIDAFILAELESQGLEPAPEADKRTLIRRAAFDLTGLPPTPGQVDRFLQDASPNVYDKLIRDLLASPRYGERWARHWLDLVRYADSGGYETDEYFPNSWRYRDYVIKSLNENKPYDRFLQEQIAGDELWPDDLELHDNYYGISPEKLEHLEARIGTGLYTFGPEIVESLLDAPKLAYERMTDWVDTTGAVFMGLTLACARCHDHKFDPVSQRDYFRLQAVFAASDAMEVPVVTRMSRFHRNETYSRMIAVDEARRAYKLYLDGTKKRMIAAVKSEFPPEVVSAHELPDEKKTPQQAELAAPLIEALRALNKDWEDRMTPEEKEEKKRLLEEMGKLVVLLPEADASHLVKFDGLYDVPKASVLGHREVELIPEVHVLDRGRAGPPAGPCDSRRPGRIRLPGGLGRLGAGIVREPNPADAPATGPLAEPSRSPPHGTGDGQPALAMALRAGNRPHFQRLRSPGGASHPSGTAGLAGSGVRGPGLGHQVDAPVDHVVRHLPDGQPLFQPAKQRTGPGQPHTLAHEPAPPGGGSHVGHPALGGGDAEPENGGTPGGSTVDRRRAGRVAGSLSLAGLCRPRRAHAPGDLHPVPEKLHLSHVPDLRPARLFAQLSAPPSDHGGASGALVSQPQGRPTAGSQTGRAFGDRPRRRSVRLGGGRLADYIEPSPLGGGKA